MAAIAGFIGPTNTFAAPAVDAEQTVNLYVDSTAPGIAKAPLWLRGTPGLTVFAGFGVTGEMRALFAQDGRAFGVMTGLFGEIFENQSVVGYGFMDVDANPATIVSNGTAGHQLLISSGGSLYVFDLITNMLTWLNPAVYDVPHPCSMVEFMDGYGFALKSNSRQFQISGLEDFTAWDPLDVGERSEGSDNIAALIRSHREIWLIGTKTTEVWSDTGDTFPFAPIQGVFIEQGCPMGAGYTAQRINNTIAFLSQNENGGGMLIMMDQYAPKRVSTSPIEAQLLTTTAMLSSARAWAYQEEGHLFYVLYVPGLDTSLVYDVAMNLWAERGHWNTTTSAFTPLVAQCHMYVFGKHLVGDRLHGIIYEQTLNSALEALYEATIVMRRLRTFPLPFNENDYVFLPYLEVVLQAGLGLASGQGSDPQLMFEISRDGGKTFGVIRTASAGPQGAYRQRVMFTRNGRFRNGYGRITMTDPVPWYFVGAYDAAEAGTS